MERNNIGQLYMTRSHLNSRLLLQCILPINLIVSTFEGKIYLIAHLILLSNGSERGHYRPIG